MSHFKLLSGPRRAYGGKRSEWLDDLVRQEAMRTGCSTSEIVDRACVMYFTAPHDEREAGDALLGESNQVEWAKALYPKLNREPDAGASRPSPVLKMLPGGKRE